MHTILTILPINEAFKAGELMMPSTPGIVSDMLQMQWGDILTNKIWICICALAIAVNLNSFFMIVPALNDCFVIGKGFLQLESSPQLERSRNSLALWSLLSLIVPLSRFDILSPKILDLAPFELRTIGVALLVGIYLLIRFIFYKILTPGRRKLESYQLARFSAWSYVIPLSIVIVISSVLFSVFGMPDGKVKSLIITEMAVMYLVYLFRKSQIYSTVCGPFATFLYLCALELLPTGLFIALVSIF